VARLRLIKVGDRSPEGYFVSVEVAVTRRKIFNDACAKRRYCTPLAGRIACNSGSAKNKLNPVATFNHTNLDVYHDLEFVI
jgi:hypothetical protein